MNAIRSTQKLNERELELVTQPSASWHRDYDDTAFIYIGGLHLDMSEGDVITIFSQYGEPVFINLVRDKETGRSKGFCFLKYEDQRSCTLAVDNLGGAMVLGRMLRVDHTRYKAKDDEVIYDNTTGAPPPSVGVETEVEESSEEEEPARPLLKEEVELQKLLREVDEEDPMQAFLIEQKREEVTLAREKAERREKRMEKNGERRHRRRGESGERRRDDSRDRRRNDSRDRRKDDSGHRHERRGHRRRDEEDDELASQPRRKRRSSSGSSGERRRRARSD